MPKTTDEIIQEEIQSILDDILELYRQEKKVSGSFEEGLEAVYSPGKALIKGYVYLAGRKKGKMPPVSALLSWVKRKGIFQYKTEAQARGIAFAIAKKIANEGTSKRFELKVYEQVITPERIDSIIDKVAELNVNKIITIITAELEVLAKNV